VAKVNFEGAEDSAQSKRSQPAAAPTRDPCRNCRRLRSS